MAELRSRFRPEFLNRIDDIVLFKALTQGEIEHIVDLMFNELRARRSIARQGYDPVYGARPLRRYIAREVETRVGRAMIAGDVTDGARIRIDVVDGELVVDYENPIDATARVGV
jgi:ATP-dependent Clp protease ATP-binding subunit ClpB